MNNYTAPSISTLSLVVCGEHATVHQEIANLRGHNAIFGEQIWEKNYSVVNRMWRGVVHFLGSAFTASCVFVSTFLSFYLV